MFTPSPEVIFFVLFMAAVVSGTRLDERMKRNKRK